MGHRGQVVQVNRPDRHTIPVAALAGGQRVSAASSRSSGRGDGRLDRSLRAARSPLRSPLRLVRWSATRSPRSARRLMAQARVLGLAAWLGVQLHHHPSTENRIVLGAAHPLGQLPTRPGPDGQLAVVERHEHQVKARRGRPPAALVCGGDRALADRLGVARWHAEPVAGKGLA